MPHTITEHTYEDGPPAFSPHPVFRVESEERGVRTKSAGPTWTGLACGFCDYEGWLEPGDTFEIGDECPNCNAEIVDIK